jgi:hypothetical protein
MLVVDPPPPEIGHGDLEVVIGHQREAVGLMVSHASAAVLLQRGMAEQLEHMPTAMAAEEPYVITAADRGQVEAVRRAKFQPQTALVLETLPDFEEASGALASTTVLLDWTPLSERGGLHLRFHVINDDLSVTGPAVVRWRLRVTEPGGWLPFLRDRTGQQDVSIPPPDEPASVYERDVTLPSRGGGLVIEVGLEKDGELLSYLEYEVERPTP